LNTVNEGDGLELLKELKDEVAQLVIFDPQYKDTKNTAKHVNTHYYKLPHANQDEQNIKDFIKEIARVLKPSAFLLLWIDDLILIKGSFRQ
jgi:site-specific DNA-methyltransferase (adenine-specific)